MMPSSLDTIGRELLNRRSDKSARVFLVDYDQAQLFAKLDSSSRGDCVPPGTHLVVFSGPDSLNQPEAPDFPHGTLFWRSPAVPQGADDAIKRVFYKLRYHAGNSDQVFIVHGGGTGDKGYDAMVANERGDSAWRGSLELVNGKDHRFLAGCSSGVCNAFGVHSTEKCLCGRVTCSENDSRKWCHEQCSSGLYTGCSFRFCTHQREAEEVPDHLLTCSRCGERYCPNNNSNGHEERLCHDRCSAPLYKCQVPREYPEGTPLEDRIERNHWYESDEHGTPCPVPGCAEKFVRPTDGGEASYTGRWFRGHLLSVHGKLVVGEDTLVDARTIDDFVECFGCSFVCSSDAPRVKGKNLQNHFRRLHA